MSEFPKSTSRLGNVLLQYNNNMQALPDIQIQRKLNAKRLKLRVYPDKIFLTVPMLARKRHIQDFLAQSQAWLIQTWQKQQSSGFIAPAQIQLFNLHHPIHIVYQHQKQAFIFDEQQLFIDETQPQAALKAFIFSYAKQHLPIFLAQISQETALNYQSCSIRQAKTRWGSCSAQQNIMLSSALVLCEQHLVRYVCIHELAHTLHMNHSHDFWRVVAEFDPHYLTHRQALKQQLHALY